MRLALATALVASVRLGTDARAQTHGLMPTHSVERALEDQLACLGLTSPGSALWAMLRQRLVAGTGLGSDGIAVFRPTRNLRLFGKRVLFLSGWAMEGDRVRAPFWRGLGT
ncbi:MAG: hypothetical protein ACRYHQ_31040, partial [Janthinobacterium lividum]